ncbi:MAG TPA: RIP metalloprotease RseP [Vicinamibacterales bacterium]|nr:RIP metalloprotease RseP [Vicinamibacterales bacterium]
MTTIFAFIFVIGVLIFVHELGHYLAARYNGVRVLTFSLGFGPRLLSVTRGGTEYCVSVIPLGGYVKMAGETSDDERSGQPDEFLSKTKWQRFQILVMGPAMNIGLAILLWTGVLMAGAEIPAYVDEPPIVGSIEMGSPAERAKFAIGDRIIAVAGREVESWKEFDFVVGSRPNRDLPITVLREGRAITLNVRTDAEGPFDVGRIGVYPTKVNPVVHAVNPGEPADRAGVKTGDVVLAVEGHPVAFASQLSEAIGRRAGKPTRLTLQRDGRTIELTVTPELRGETGMIGIRINSRMEMRKIEPGPLEAFRMSLERTAEMSAAILRTLWGLIIGDVSPKQLMGPVGIAQLSGESAEQGWLPLLGLMAMISLNLGLLNLLPIPVLDGGHILILAMEGLARRNFSMRVKERMLIAGFVLLVLLMVTVIYNDLTRISWVENLMFWR